MLPALKLQTLQKLIETSTKEELIWINGYLSGIVAHNGNVADIVNGTAGSVAPQVKKISIVFGTETGNSKKLAATFAARAKKKGITVKLTGLDQYRLNDLAKEEYLFTIISTQGEGEPPATAKKFYEHIHANAITLDKLKYGVLALGDTAYPLFCKAGEDVDDRLAQLGAQRILPLQKCDTDFETDADTWFEQVLEVLAGSRQNDNVATPVYLNGQPGKKNHKKYHTGTIITNINLNDKGSAKATHHIEIATGEAVDYLPGDSIGIIPFNKKVTVEAIFGLTGYNKETVVDYKNTVSTAEELLARKLNIVYLPQRVVQQYAQLVGQEIPDTRIDLLDLLRIYPLKQPEHFADVLNILEPMAPRLYSIASSPAAHDSEVHITVARDRFCVNEETKNGLCSDYLSGLQEGSAVGFYIHRNNLFRLPAADKDIVMIGPGTGIAPFRSFIAERDATGAEGKNWLFFGEQHFRTDFLYQTEWQNYLQTGVLTQMHVAFSRDQQQKVYVQHKLLEHGQALWDWLQKGAHLYVCGSKQPMSEDVEKALLQVVQQHGQKSESEALQYLEKLKEEERYLKDVY